MNSKDKYILNSIHPILEQEDIKDQQCVIHLGKFNAFGGNNSLTKNHYDKILNACRKKFEKCKIINVKEYYINNLVMSIDQNKKEYYRKEYNTNYRYSSNFCFFVKNKKSINIEQFPIIKYYNNIKTNKIIQFNNSPIIISLITENYNENYYHVIISFYNKSDNKRWIIGKIIQTMQFLLYTMQSINNYNDIILN